MADYPSPLVAEPYVEKVGTGIYAYIQPDGSWCLSNGGLIIGQREAMLIDTLSDLPKTRAMLNQFDKILAQCNAQVTTLVNTHHNLDHVWGNQLVVSRYPGVRTLASSRAVEEMHHDVKPEQLLAVLDKARSGQLGRQPGSFGSFLTCRFSHLAELDQIAFSPPKETFEGALDVDVGGRTVKLIELGPAHTSGDIIIHVPDAKVVFAGDLLFNRGVPIVWTANPSGWIRACNAIIGLEPAVVVAGHGPVADGVAAVEDLRDYLDFVVRHTRAAVNLAKPSVEDAALDVAGKLPKKYKTWGEQERHIINVLSVYKQLAEESDNAAAKEALEKSFPHQSALYIMYKFAYRMKHAEWEALGSPCKPLLNVSLR